MENFINKCKEFNQKFQEENYNFELRNKYPNSFYSYDECETYQRWLGENDHCEEYFPDTSKHPESILSLDKFLTKFYSNISFLNYKEIMNNSKIDEFENQDYYNTISYKIRYIDFNELYAILKELKLIEE